MFGEVVGFLFGNSNRFKFLVSCIEVLTVLVDVREAKMIMIANLYDFRQYLNLHYHDVLIMQFKKKKAWEKIAFRFH